MCVQAENQTTLKRKVAWLESHAAGASSGTAAASANTVVDLAGDVNNGIAWIKCDSCGSWGVRLCSLWGSRLSGELGANVNDAAVLIAPMYGSSTQLVPHAMLSSTHQPLPGAPKLVL